MGQISSSDSLLLSVHAHQIRVHLISGAFLDLPSLLTPAASAYGFAPAGFGDGSWAMPVPLLGVIVCLLWYRIINSHRDLNRVKFKLIHALEQHLPATPYTLEWQIAEQGTGRPYCAVTDIERWIPWTFLVLHGVWLLGLALRRPRAYRYCRTDSGWLVLRRPRAEGPSVFMSPYGSIIVLRS